MSMSYRPFIRDAKKKVNILDIVLPFLVQEILHLFATAIDVNPMTLLSALLRTDEEMQNLHGRLKLSAFERDLGFFVIKHRGYTDSGKGVSFPD